MFNKFKQFWSRFWSAWKSAYNAVFKHPTESKAQSWRQIDRINFLDIIVGKLNNLTNNEATFDVVSDSSQADVLKDLCKDIESKRYDITAEMLANGDYWCFPATNEKGEIYHTYLTQQQVRILNMDGDNITEAYGIIDWYVDKNNRLYYLLRHHKLDQNGTLEITYSSIDEQGKPALVDEWEYLADEFVVYQNANHIGFGRYKSPTSSRGTSAVYGVPLNYGCAEIEDTIFHDIKLINDEFENGKSVIFTDPRNLLKDEERAKYKIAENIIPIQSRAGQSGSNIDIFNPTLRFSEHYSKLQNDLALYEKQIGTSKGVLTESEQTSNATATEIRRANADTVALLDKIRTAINDGNRMTLEADGVFLNIAPDLWVYSSDWYDPFENPAEQWQRLIEGQQVGAVEKDDLIKWLFPDLTTEERAEKIERLNEEQSVNSDLALERILNGGA